ncbi:Clavaminate synthase-like protein [Glarea lozoyensis ATCC 20868]|uniref:Clavaminate synthase-like protein n=1 Tax=Glarea lozoyensis (strain ATCC 20868 / MF5171) TaxID=1116229 RepID=S3D5E8_GLAL2|nr:Clavaminate synthase-like protein [Glarea lozoyensis ATCC 20868]EPE33005.1 Clavaminate synthase-like protein [Glarea lozoyensis ATCC 20868]
MAAACATYTPSELDTKRFWDIEASRQKTKVEIPYGFPAKLESSLAWKGEDIDVENEQAEWKLDLTDEEISAIDAALKTFEGKNHELSALSASTFELPSEFSQRLRSLSDQLYEGVGFQIIHGLDPTKYNSKQQMIVYAGVSAHICPQRGTVDVKGTGVLAHIVNVQAGNKLKATAPAFSNIPLSFHTDNCEIMAFFYLDTAIEGGETMLSSIWQTYNELAATRPEVLHTLTEPWVLDTFKPLDLQPPRHCRLLQQTGCPKIPVLFRFSRYPITGWQRQRNAALSIPTTAQHETADAIQFIAMKNAITLPVAKGDMLFVNDLALFHARTGFKDDDIPMKRHLVKMYFRDPEQGWDIPEEMENEWRTSYKKEEGMEEVWNVLYKAGIEELSMLNG